MDGSLAGSIWDVSRLNWLSGVGCLIRWASVVVVPEGEDAYRENRDDGYDDDGRFFAFGRVRCFVLVAGGVFAIRRIVIGLLRPAILRRDAGSVHAALTWPAATGLAAAFTSRRANSRCEGVAATEGCVHADAAARAFSTAARFEALQSRLQREIERVECFAVCG